MIQELPTLSTRAATYARAVVAPNSDPSGDDDSQYERGLQHTLRQAFLAGAAAAQSSPKTFARDLAAAFTHQRSAAELQIDKVLSEVQRYLGDDASEPEHAALYVKNALFKLSQQVDAMKQLARYADWLWEHDEGADRIVAQKIRGLLSCERSK